MSTRFSDKTLEILFRDLSPTEALLSPGIFSFIDSGTGTDFRNKDRFQTAFVRGCHRSMTDHTDDEKMRLFQFMCQGIRAQTGDEYFPHIFIEVLRIAEECLVFDAGKNIPVVKFEKLLRWRMLTISLGEELLSTCFSAHKANISETSLPFELWPIMLGVSENDYHKILDKGIHENHFHLLASSPVFSIGWIRLMNRIGEQADFISAISLQKQNPLLLHSDGVKNIGLRQQALCAAALRVYLFLKVRELNEDSTPSVAAESSFLGQVTEWLKRPAAIEVHIASLQQIVFTLRKEAKFTIQQKDAEDYAWREIAGDEMNEGFILAGERGLLCNCYKHIFSKKADRTFIGHFHSYLVIKTQIRSEYVQNNQRPGFKNFQTYQARKGIVMDNGILADAGIRMAINGTFEDAAIQSIEARVSPDKNPLKLASRIKKIMSLKNKPLVSWMNYAIELPDYFTRINDGENDQGDCNCFFVLHFIKSPDTPVGKFRNWKTRKTIEAQAMAIAALRKQGYCEARHVYGIDAASSESGCRPEVFATVFRFLRPQGILEKSNNGAVLPVLKATYHVGEDFYDIIDGLRAIDEAIEFLELNQIKRKGERIGHALALGVNAKEWYESKGKVLLKKKQDHLDDLAWIWYHLRETDEFINSGIDEIEQGFNDLFREVYNKNYGFEPGGNILETYCNAWKLRGDEPEYYIKRYHENPGALPVGDALAQSYLRMNDPGLTKTRLNKIAVDLYLDYHINSKIKKKGAEFLNVPTQGNYIKCAILLQKVMRHKILRNELAIETNPSSNVQIGNFKRYDAHPIFTFNSNHILDAASEKLPGLPASINTDDMGIFDISLKSEFLLMALALEKAKDKDGNVKYKNESIKKWLEEVRDAGTEQTFKKHDESWPINLTN